MSYCIDDPNPPYTGVRGKGTVKFLVDIDKNFCSIDRFSVGIEGISFSLISPSCCMLVSGCALIRYYHWYLKFYIK
jgi:hypothetical protein